MKNLLLLFTFAVVGLIAFGNSKSEDQIVNIRIHASKKPETQSERLERLAVVYDVPVSVVKLIFHYESSSGTNIKPKFEPHVVGWLFKKERPAEFRKKVLEFTNNGKDKKRLELLASSHGSMQVMGYHALVYGIDPQKLASDPLTQDELGVVLAANAWHKKPHLPIPARLFVTGIKFNGSVKYASRLVKDWINGVTYENV